MSSSAASNGDGGGSGGGGGVVLSRDVADLTEQDRLTMAQQEGIRQQIAAAQPLVGPPEPPSVLAAEYQGASSS